MNTELKMKPFMIVLHGKTSDWNKFPDAEQHELIQKYMAWVEKLKSEGRFKSGSELHPQHRDLKSANGQIIVDGPFPETKEILTGFFIIKATSLEEAVEVSKGCPALIHGDRLQVYEMPDRE